MIIGLRNWKFCLFAEDFRSIVGFFGNVKLCCFFCLDCTSKSISLKISKTIPYFLGEEEVCFSFVA